MFLPSWRACSSTTRDRETHGEPVSSEAINRKSPPRDHDTLEDIVKLVRIALLGSAAGLCAVARAQAADLPVKKTAPVEYVRVCTAYGAGFFYIPGTDTCLRVGGRARFEYEFRSYRSRGVYSSTTFAPAAGSNSDQ